MANDYNSSQRKSSGKQSSSFLTGLLVGLFLGIVIAVAFTIYIKGGTSIFTTPPTGASIPELEKSADDNALEETERPKSRFDFYDILQGNDHQVDEQEGQASTKVETNSQEAYFLQVGAFSTEYEADNMKAKLALLGLEATVEVVVIENKGTLHRVRVGPYTDLNQVNKVKSDLKDNGYAADVKKVVKP
jgi:cell division protein FtsN